MSSHFTSLEGTNQITLESMPLTHACNTTAVGIQAPSGWLQRRQLKVKREENTAWHLYGWKQYFISRSLIEPTKGGKRLSEKFKIWLDTLINNLPKSIKAGVFVPRNFSPWGRPIFKQLFQIWQNLLFFLESFLIPALTIQMPIGLCDVCPWQGLER